MKHLLLLTAIAAILIPAASLFAEEENEINFDEKIERLERQVEIERLNMRLEAERSEMEFENQMRQLELDQRRTELENQGRKAGYRDRYHHKGCGAFIMFLGLIGIAVRVLAATWVYQDLRARKKGSGLWIAITILAGLFGALVYAVTRVGDKKSS